MQVMRYSSGMTRGLRRVLIEFVVVGATMALLVATETGGAHFLLFMSGLVAGALHASREPNFSLRGAAVALAAAAAIGTTGWLAVEGEYPLWAWGAALAIGIVAPLIPELADVREESGQTPSAESPPADRVMADYTRAARL